MGGQRLSRLQGHHTLHCCLATERRAQGREGTRHTAPRSGVEQVMIWGSGNSPTMQDIQEKCIGQPLLDIASKTRRTCFQDEKKRHMGVRELTSNMITCKLSVSEQSGKHQWIKTNIFIFLYY